ncbi:MAG: hypothetical protein KAH13_03665 [Tenericutes bacterium]|nr:hypothetical protein [Mycoplasmatota bacterium]
MKLDLLRELYVKNLIPDKDLTRDLDMMVLLNDQIEFELDDINQDVLDDIIIYMVNEDINTVDNFVVLMRYFHVIDRKDLFIHLTKYTGMLGVMDEIIKRLVTLKGESKAKVIIGGYQVPHLGVHPKKLPKYAKDMMDRLDGYLEIEEVEEVLSGNNHSVPVETQIPEKIYYEGSDTFSEYLIDRHSRKVAELKQHFDDNKVWYEQIITQEVLDYVASNQEILSGVIKDELLYITKIPYDTLSYLNAKTNKNKKYFGCHCPFAREALKSGNLDISGRFCYCSAGFAKFPYEVILGQKLKVKVEKSILLGDDVCRFVINLENVDYKK